MRGAFLVNERGCPFHHRLERLILIECAGRAAMENSGYERKACLDCNQVHIELFEVNVSVLPSMLAVLFSKLPETVEAMNDGSARLFCDGSCFVKRC